MHLPLYGRIAAGTPIEALRDETNMLDVPPDLIGSGDHYALEVEGDSMVDAGIHDGDYVIIQRCTDAENGTIVVALVDREEVTLKRLRRKGASIALEPANMNYETHISGLIACGSKVVSWASFGSISGVRPFLRPRANPARLSDRLRPRSICTQIHRVRTRSFLTSIGVCFYAGDYPCRPFATTTGS